MAIDFSKQEILKKRTKPRTTDMVVEGGFLIDCNEDDFVSFEEYFEPFISKEVSLSVTESTKIDLNEDEQE